MGKYIDADRFRVEIENLEERSKWLWSLPKRLNLQPKNEWSEEDEKNFEEAISYIKDDGLKDFIKSLRPQPHTVSIKDATKFGNLDYERGVKDGIQSERSRQWKPSEEQIEAMEYVIRDYREDGCNATANHLQEILDHLKNM